MYIFYIIIKDHLKNKNHFVELLVMQVYQHIKVMNYLEEMI